MRNPRAQSPGSPFHITARIQSQAKLFTPEINDQIAAIIAHGVNITDSCLLALKVMPNHLHIVLIQGPVPLGWILQPILHRVALLVQREHELSDHVFGRRFSSSPITHPDYLRTAIAYTHRNAYRAGLCKTHSAYRWSTHRAYCLGASRYTWEKQVDSERGLKLFAKSPDSTLAELRRNYLAYVLWLDSWDAAKNRGENPRWEPPTAEDGDRFYKTLAAGVPTTPPKPRNDLGDMARSFLAQFAPDLDIEQLRGTRVSRAQAHLRRRVMKLLRENGYRCAKIARYFKVSLPTVSNARDQGPWPVG
jgi:REP element-mobilizing transposase RayT